jgi:hypothetical protein
MSEAEVCTAPSTALHSLFLTIALLFATTQTKTKLSYMFSLPCPTSSSDLSIYQDLKSKLVQGQKHYPHYFMSSWPGKVSPLVQIDFFEEDNTSQWVYDFLIALEKVAVPPSTTISCPACWQHFIVVINHD